MKTRITLFITLCLLSLSVIASDCDHLYPNNTPIEVPDTVELCNEFYVVRYSLTMKAAILASEVVSPKHPNIERKDSFRPDQRIPKEYRASVLDYLKSGYDKGHVVPAGDAQTPELMRSTFLLSNMTPQVPNLNRGAWRELEYAVRGKVVREGKEVKVVTGMVYGDAPATIGKNKIPVPSSYYKVAYYPSGTLAYTVRNADDADISKSSTNDISVLTSIKFPN